MTKINKIYVIGFAIILTLPLLAITPYFFPPDFGKTIVFRSVLVVLILLLTWQFLYKKESLNLPDIKKNMQSIFSSRVQDKRTSSFIPLLLENKIILALGALFLTFLLASIFSVDSYFSFWGWPIRGGGFINFASYILFAIISFMVIKKESWLRLWDFSIFIGLLVCTVAIIQYYGLLGSIFVPITSRPPSTMGNPILLAIYLLLLFFFTLARAIEEKKPWKKAFYISSLAIFSFVILMAGSRAVYLGILFSAIYFFLQYPSFNAGAVKKIRALKVVVIILLLATIGAVIYVNTGRQLPGFVQNSRLANSVISRLSIKNFIEDSRFSTLSIGFNMTKDKPLFGYGPENFSVGFDKHYNANPSLFGIVGWWDRAHNIILQTISDAGILGLITYLALFIVVFWKLHKLKQVLPHAIQATLIGYFIANLFSFDSFSSYLIFFLLIGYSMHLVQGDTNLLITSESTNTTRPGLVGKATLLLLCCLAVVFLWQYSIVPLRINAKINQAQTLVNQRNCGEGLNLAEEALQKRSFLDSYARLQYVQLSKTCAEFYPQNKIGYLKKGLELIGQAIKIQPNYTRYWIFMGSASNDIAIEEKDETIKNALITQAHGYLAEALKLAPQHQEIPVQQARLAITAKDYQGARSYAQNCIVINREFGECYFYLALAQIYENGAGEAENNLQLASQSFGISSKMSLEQLANAYGSIMDYKNLASVYEKLSAIDPTSAQYHSSLAFFYSKLGRYQEARERALKVLELSPESKPNVEAFLKTLP